jgi:hypothetical protein
VCCQRKGKGERDKARGPPCASGSCENDRTVENSRVVVNSTSGFSKPGDGFFFLMKIVRGTVLPPPA